jgi:Zn-dependent M28 family amino/carboxypeptidase
LIAFSPLTAATQNAVDPNLRESEIPDANTREWWRITAALSGDAMEGRDTGSAAYERAAQYVANLFEQYGLKPAGEGGSYFQKVPLHEAQVTKNGTSFTLVRDGGAEVPLESLQQIWVRAADNLPPSLEAPLAFRGYCSRAEMGEIKDKIAVCFNTRRSGMTTGAQRLEAALSAGAVGMILVDDPYFSIEPPRWPFSYARTVVTGDVGTSGNRGRVAMVLTATSFASLIEGTGRNADDLLAAGGRTQPLPAFDIPAKLRVKLNVVKRNYSSNNVLAMLPGTDPKLKDEYVVVSAHLDGYGYGEPVNGDKLYNGTLDDAAYVASLIEFAKLQRGQGLRRSILFSVFTGEEKGHLGSNWFTRHPTVPLAMLTADINLDILRPIFPLTILTTLAVDESTLGQTVRDVANAMRIAVRPDMEQERGLLQRSDHWEFMQVGVPAGGFIFGFDPGTDAEKRYREWYEVRYHRPQDDLTQPIDFEAAAKFNAFFYKLTQSVASADERPRWLESSPYKRK